MTDIKEAREIELKSDWDLLSSPSRRIAESQQAVIDQLRERVAELEDEYSRLRRVADNYCGICTSLQEELSALKSAPVVMPERQSDVIEDPAGYDEGWNACLDESSSTLSVEASRALVQRICNVGLSSERKASLMEYASLAQKAFSRARQRQHC